MSDAISAAYDVARAFLRSYPIDSLLERREAQPDVERYLNARRAGRKSNVKKLLRKYLDNYRDGRIDIKALHSAVEASQSITSPYPITVYEQGDEDGSNFGWLIRESDKATIVYSHNSNLCWSRWLTTKELSHILFDAGKPEQMTKDAYSLVSAQTTGIVTDDMQGPLASEQITPTVALELLVPWGHNGELQHLLNCGATPKEIAEWYKIPEKFVEMRLSLSKNTECARENERIDKEYCELR